MATSYLRTEMQVLSSSQRHASFKLEDWVVFNYVCDYTRGGYLGKCPNMLLFATKGQLLTRQLTK